MSAVEVAPVVVEPGTSDSDIDHWHCCRDENALLCGGDGTGMPFGHNQPRCECIGCATNSDRGLCPRFGRCPDDDEASN